MKSTFLESHTLYTGAQLAPLENYLKHGLLGDSIVAWVGPCEVSLDHMIDGEDLRVGAAIAAESMLHFVIEIFHQDLFAGILLQRLLGELVKGEIYKSCDDKILIDRRGDDLFYNGGKLNVSIATKTPNSFLIHYGINMINAGTPVKTASLADFGITNAQRFSESIMKQVTDEIKSQRKAACKVKVF